MEVADKVAPAHLREFSSRRRHVMRCLAHDLRDSVLHGPARLVSEAAADRLGIPEAVLGALARDGVINVLGAPATNAPKRFYGPYITELRQNIEFCEEAERYRIHYWASRSARAQNASAASALPAPHWTAFPLKMAARPISEAILRSAFALDPVVGIGVVEELLGFLPHEVRLLVKSRTLPVIGGSEKAWRHKRFYFRHLLELYHDPRAMDRAERAITAHWAAKNAAKAGAPSAD